MSRALACCALLSLGSCRNPCDDGFGRAADGNCYPLAQPYDETTPPPDRDTDTTSDSSYWPWGGTGLYFYDGPALLEYVEATCSGSTFVLTGDVRGWVADALVSVVHTGGAPVTDEEHSLPSVDFGPYGYWDLIQRELATENPLWSPDTSTQYACTADVSGGRLTYALSIWDADMNFADCATWGHDPAGLIAGSYTLSNASPTQRATHSGCLNWQ